MKVSDGEKLILLMLCELFEKNGVESEFDPVFISSVLMNGNSWAIPYKYSGIGIEESETPEVVNEVFRILEMWEVIEYSYEELSEEAKESVKEKVERMDGPPKFIGFDGNNEADYLAKANIIIENLDRFTRFQKRYLNSHRMTLEVHFRMMEVFYPIWEGSNYVALDSDKLVTVLSARYIG